MVISYLGHVLGKVSEQQSAFVVHVALETANDCIGYIQRLQVYQWNNPCLQGWACILSQSNCHPVGQSTAQSVRSSKGWSPYWPTLSVRNIVSVGSNIPRPEWVLDLWRRQRVRIWSRECTGVPSFSRANSWREMFKRSGESAINVLFIWDKYQNAHITLPHTGVWWLRI